LPPPKDAFEAIDFDDLDGDVCEFYLEGDCRYGDECFNLHIDLPVNMGQNKPMKSM
jgi:hypothetical protein